MIPLEKFHRPNTHSNRLSLDDKLFELFSRSNRGNVVRQRLVEDKKFGQSNLVKKIETKRSFNNFFYAVI